MATSGTIRAQRHRDGPMQLAAARSARQRAYRARRHQGRITLPVEVDEAALAVALVDAGLITAAEQDDRRALAGALSKVVEIITAESLSLVALRITPPHS